MQYQNQTTLAPLTIPRTKIVADLSAHRDQVLADFDRVEEIKTEGVDDLVAALDADQKAHLKAWIVSRWGDDAEQITSDNAKRAELRRLQHEDARQNATKAVDRLLAIYTSATNDVVEVGMDDGILLFLRTDADA